MKYLQPTTQFKKDYKKIKNNPKKVALLKNVLLMYCTLKFTLVCYIFIELTKFAH